MSWKDHTTQKMHKNVFTEKAIKSSNKSNKSTTISLNIWWALKRKHEELQTSKDVGKLSFLMFSFGFQALLSEQKRTAATKTVKKY